MSAGRPGEGKFAERLFPIGQINIQIQKRIFRLFPLRLELSGADGLCVGEILGNPTSVKRYVHLTPDHLKAAIKVLDRKPVCHNPATTDLSMVVENAV